jgi:hypothetical protein
MTKTRVKRAVCLIAALMLAGCSGPPALDGLKDSFAQQVAANKFVREFRRSGEDLFFSAPGRDGEVAKWRVHVDTAVVEPNSDPAQPYKGIVKSSWFANDEIVRPVGNISNLPVELLSNGVSQDCWAFWNKAAKKWTWE